MKRRKWICKEAALVGASLLLVAGCGGGAASDEGGGNETGKMTAEVTVVKVARGDIQQAVTLSGNVIALPNEDVKVSALVPGRITALNVAEGDRVTKGEVLAALDDSNYQQQFAQAQAALLQANANLKNAEQSLTRNQTLFKRGIAARMDLESAQAQLTVAQAAQQQARASEELARLQLERTKILSPLTGVVAKRFANIGEQVDGTAAQPIVEVADIAVVDLAGNLPAAYLSRVHIGETLTVTSDAFSGKAFAGRVVAVAPAVDPSTNVGGVRIRIVNPGALLKLGMYLNAQVRTEAHKNALVIPAEAIYHDESGKPVVYEVSEGVAKSTDVTIGIENEGKAEILDGVKEGDTIILTGGYGLDDGTKVKIKS
ncbi:MAG TPA: efflux RND transporter periplasmic adaptor subunit [Candidatus Acidoferrales bacterium]|nr:efflux RND transporter periplasmic adaptor subunit [Candidatus Acidoferrales bacterium]